MLSFVIFLFKIFYSEKKKRPKCFEEIVAVDRGLTNQVPEAVRIPGDPLPSHRPRRPAEAVRASR